MGNTSSRVRRRVPKNLKKAKSKQEKLRKHEIPDNESGHENKNGGEHRRTGEDASTAGKNTIYIGYDSDAEVLDFKDLLNENVAKIKRNIDSEQERERYDQSQAQAEGKMICWDESPTLV